MGKEKLGFKYERKRIKRDYKMPPLCSEYEPDRYENCEKAKICKNATYASKEEASGHCFGGTKSSEREYREKYKEYYYLVKA